ncbi:hypothetical protein TcCL_NonESM03449 [Trypanosoma cruzi]|nr:hypothetical protein TcCL_NonESM03449 [Trypanosoma cruzi]
MGFAQTHVLPLLPPWLHTALTPCEWGMILSQSFFFALTAVSGELFFFLCFTAGEGVCLCVDLCVEWFGCKEEGANESDGVDCAGESVESERGGFVMHGHSSTASSTCAFRGCGFKGGTAGVPRGAHSGAAGGINDEASTIAEFTPDVKHTHKTNSIVIVALQCVA